MYHFSKRIIDITVSAIALMFLTPIFLIIWILIKLDDGGPLFYSQIRIGKNGYLFQFWKLRTMCIQSDQLRSSIVNPNVIRFKDKNDSRITKVGRVLRKLSLDEFPQFWNVLVGDMSLVGPRPPIPEEVSKYTSYQMQRLSVPQGLTCLWQIKGRSLIPFEEQVELDLEYIKNRGLFYDLKLVALTIPAVLGGKGAY